MSRFNVGDEVVIKVEKYNSDRDEEYSIGMNDAMRYHDKRKTKISEIISEYSVRLEVSGNQIWHINWLVKKSPKMETSVDLDIVKSIQRALKENKFTQSTRDGFDGRAYKDVIYIQEIDEKDRLDKTTTILNGFYYTQKLDRINRSKDFFVFNFGELYLYGKKRRILCKDVPILKMAEPVRKKTDKPISLFAIKSKDVDSDLLTTIYKLVEKSKECDVSADIHFMLGNLKTKGELQESMAKIKEMSRRSYDEEAWHLFSTISFLTESL